MNKAIDVEDVGGEEEDVIVETIDEIQTPHVFLYWLILSSFANSMLHLDEN